MMRTTEERLKRFFETEMSAEEIRALREELMQGNVSPEAEADRALFLQLTDEASYELYEMSEDSCNALAAHVDRLTEETAAPCARHILLLRYAVGAAAVVLLCWGGMRYYQHTQVPTLYTDTCQTVEEAEEATLMALQHVSMKMRIPTKNK